MNQKIETTKLIINGFSGEQILKVNLARWNHHESDGYAGLNLHLECDEYLTISDELKGLFSICTWGVSILQNKLAESDIKSGFEAFIPKSFSEDEQDHVTEFFFTEHTGTDNNRIKILDRVGSKLLVEMSGEVIDLVHFESKPPSKIHVKGWFEKRES